MQRRRPTPSVAGLFAIFGALLAGACGAGAAVRGADPPPPSGVQRLPLRYDRHLPSLPVRLDGDVDARFALDTGIGINLISKPLCRMLECVSAGHYSGKRMSGQEVTVPLAKVRSLAVGDEEHRDVVVGLIDLDAFVEAPDIQGFLSLGFFARRAFTLDERKRELVLESPASLERRMADGTVVSVSVRREGEGMTVFLPLEVGGQSVVAKVDTGSDALILDERFMSPLRIDKAMTKVVEGRDETGHAFTRWFTDLGVGVHPTGAPDVRRVGLRTMFQKIVHDGLVGRSFLEPWIVTFDLPRERMVFARPPAKYSDPEESSQPLVRRSAGEE